MRRLLVIVVCFLPLTLSLASANGSSPPVRGRIVYSSDRGPNVHAPEIYSINADGSHERRLTRNNVKDVLPAWSPGHTRIAFARDDSIWIMSARGTNQHRLRRGTHPSWSPRGSRIVFERGGAVYTMTNRGRSVRRITGDGNRPAWAPRGTRIAFVRGQELLIAHAGTKRVRRLADLDCGDYGEGGVNTFLSTPEWSPDARRLIVAVTCVTSRIITVSAKFIDARRGVVDDVPIDFRRERAGGCERGCGPWSRVAWSPNGARLAYLLETSPFGDDPRIVTARLDGSSMTTVTTGAAQDRDPDW